MKYCQLATEYSSPVSSQRLPYCVLGDAAHRARGRAGTSRAGARTARSSDPVTAYTLGHTWHMRPKPSESPRPRPHRLWPESM